MTGHRVPPEVIADVEDHLSRALGPSLGRPHQLSEVAVSSDGTRIVVTGAVLDALEGRPRTTVYEVRDRALVALTSPSHSARAAAFARQRRVLAYLSDENQRGVFRVVVRDLDDPDRDIATPEVTGSVEVFAWSPDGRRLLVVTENSGPDGPARRAWTLVLEATDATLVPVGDRGCWEASWVGDQLVAVVVSDGSREDDWYRTSIVLVDAATGECVGERAPEPGAQIALPCGSPDGGMLAWVEGRFSDRRLVAGRAVLYDVTERRAHDAETNGADVARLQWVDAARLGFVGQRHLDCVAGVINIRDGHTDELIATTNGFAGRWGPDGCFSGDGSVVCVEEAYGVAQSIVRIAARDRSVVVDIADAGTQYLASVGGSLEQVTWRSPDGTAIEGFLCRPPGPGPFPLVLNIHGGPVTAVRNTWSLTWPWTPLLVRAGYAVLSPNPRGSTGRGPDFVAPVVGDMAGRDTDDLISGIDAMVDRGIADAQRVGVIGISYGGFMASWLICVDPRFAAAVAIAPITDWYSQTFTSVIPSWGRTFLSAAPEDPGGRMHTRSPVLRASAISTPCLLIAGSADPWTPPGQAQELYQALEERGVATDLAVYPGEGHGIRAYPAVADHLARIQDWFATHLPA